MIDSSRIVPLRYIVNAALLVLFVAFFQTAPAYADEVSDIARLIELGDAYGKAMTQFRAKEITRQELQVVACTRADMVSVPVLGGEGQPYSITTGSASGGFCYHRGRVRVDANTHMTASDKVQWKTDKLGNLRLGKVPLQAVVGEKNRYRNPNPMSLRHKNSVYRSLDRLCCLVLAQANRIAAMLSESGGRGDSDREEPGIFSTVN